MVPFTRHMWTHVDFSYIQDVNNLWHKILIVNPVQTKASTSLEVEKTKNKKKIVKDSFHNFIGCH